MRPHHCATAVVTASVGQTVRDRGGRQVGLDHRNPADRGEGARAGNGAASSRRLSPGLAKLARGPCSSAARETARHRPESFPLGNVRAWDGQQFQFFGNRPDIGVRGPYRLVRNEDCWGATPQTASYQHLVNAPGCSSPDEWLASIGDVYGHAAVIGANLDPISGTLPGEPAYAAAIFLHRNSYTSAGASKPTSGCVSLSEDDLEFALRLIDPSLNVQFAIGELSWLRASA